MNIQKFISFLCDLPQTALFTIKKLLGIPLLIVAKVTVETIEEVEVVTVKILHNDLATGEITIDNSLGDATQLLIASPTPLLKTCNGIRLSIFDKVAFPVSTGTIEQNLGGADGSVLITFSPMITLVAGQTFVLEVF